MWCGPMSPLTHCCSPTAHPLLSQHHASDPVLLLLLQPEDSFFLLACDGVWDVMTNQQAVDFINQKLQASVSPTDAACALLDECLAADPKAARGVGCDNMTAIVVILKQNAAS